MSRLIADFAGTLLYLDTMVFHLLLRVRGSAAEPLFRRIQQGQIRAYTSVLTFDELAFRMLLALIRDRYPGSPLDNLRQNEARLIAELQPEIEPPLVRLQKFPNLSLVDVTPADLTAMHENMRRYFLRPRDALHLAAMQKVGCLHIVSQDADFERIPGVECYTLA